MTQFSPTALEEAWQAYQNTPIDLVADSDEETKRCVIAAITAYLAQREKEGWVMVRGAEVDELRSALKGLSDMYGSTWDRVDGGLMMMGSGVDCFEKAHRAAYEVLNPDAPLLDDDEKAASQEKNDA